MKDLTSYFIDAGERAQNWSRSRFTDILEQVTQTIPLTSIDWDDEAGEDWGSVFHESHVAAIIRVDAPIAIVIGSREELTRLFLTEGLVVITAKDWLTEEYSMDQPVCEGMFPRWTWRKVDMDYDRISICDLWWATI